MIQSGNWRGACDLASELEAVGVHVIQRGNWREARATCNSFVQNRDNL